MEAGRPSRTAEYVALFRALETARPADERLVDDPWAIRFLSPGLRLAALLAHLPGGAALVAGVLDRRWPGPRLSTVVRTRMVDDLVTAALDAGAHQLVLLGAGYDTRGLRLPSAAASSVFEVDHPSTQARKRAAFAPAAAHATTYVPVDFERDDLRAALRGAGFAEGRPTCVVWEGVLSYLSLPAIDATLGSVTAACTPGSAVVLTYVDAAALDHRDARWIRAVEAAGEPFVTGLRPGEAPAFFARRGLRLRSDVSTRAAGEALVGPAGARRIPPVHRVAELEVAG